MTALRTRSTNLKKKSVKCKKKHIDTLNYKKSEFAKALTKVKKITILRVKSRNFDCVVLNVKKKYF